MGMSILIHKESEDTDYIVYKFGLDSKDINKLRINKKTLEFEKVDSVEEAWNYIFFKAGSYIKKQYLEKGAFPDSITCSS